MMFTGDVVSYSGFQRLKFSPGGWD